MNPNYEAPSAEEKHITQSHNFRSPISYVQSGSRMWRGCCMC